MLTNSVIFGSVVHSPIILVHKAVESLNEFRKANEKPFGIKDSAITLPRSGWHLQSTMSRSTRMQRSVDKIK